jgi:thiol-disulfide isomerase/thioredoxin
MRIMMRKLLFVVALAGFYLLAAASSPAQAQSPQPGDKLPALSLKYQGNPPDLAGKPVLLEFWATWCPPCRKSIPHLNAVYEKYRAKGLEIVGVTDENDATVRKFQEKIPMKYNVAIQAPSSLFQQFGVEGIPTAFLADRNGKIVWTGHPMELSDAVLAKVVD